MNPKTVRAIDVWVGKPLCFALTAWRRLLALVTLGGRAVGPEGPPIKKILFIKMIEQGATVLAHSAITRAGKMVGRENVYFWVFRENRAILDLLELVPPENVLEIRTTSLIRCGLDLIATLWRIRRMGIDATIDMEFFARASAALAYMTGARRRVGLHRFTNEGPYRGDLLTHRVQHNPYLHTAVAYGVLVEALTADPRDLPLLKRSAKTLAGPADQPSFQESMEISRPIAYLAPPPRLKVTEAELQTVRATMARLARGEMSRPIVLLNPNASDLLPLRRWPTERFIELGQRLLADEPGATIVITGAPDEAVAAREITRKIDSSAATGDRPRCITTAGETTLRELLVLYTISDVLVTNDSGPGHFAAMTDIDNIVLFGPETPALFGPIGRRNHVIWAGLACSPCVNALNHRFSPCRNNVCMQEITVEQVLTVVRSVLRRRAADAPPKTCEEAAHAIPG